MSEAPERITVTFNNWRNPNAGAAYKNSAGDTGYVRDDRIEELEAENHLLKTAGIIEVAARNPSVMEYMQHWEGRAEAAEERSEVLEELVMDVVNDLREGVSGSKIDSRICKAMKNLEWGE